MGGSPCDAPTTGPAMVMKLVEYDGTRGCMVGSNGGGIDLGGSHMVESCIVW